MCPVGAEPASRAHETEAETCRTNPIQQARSILKIQFTSLARETGMGRRGGFLEQGCRTLWPRPPWKKKEGKRKAALCRNAFARERILQVLFCEVQPSGV